MLSGRRAFTGGSKIETLSAILRDEPGPISDAAHPIPATLEALTRRCLEKNPSNRFDSARDLSFALRSVAENPAARLAGAPAVQSRTASSRAPVVAVVLAVAVLSLAVLGVVRTRGTSRSFESLAVLPFSNAGSNESAAYLSDGITDSLIDRFSRLPGLRVASRAAVFGYKDKTTTAQRVGQELKAEAVLTGSVEEKDGQLRVSVELVDSRDGRHIWGERYVRKASEAASLEPEIAREIVDSLKFRLSGADRTRLANQFTVDGEAYQFYLKGRYYWRESDLDQARDYFEKAIAKDPSYALAYAGLADTYSKLGHEDWVRPEAAFPKARAAALEALKIDAALVEARVALSGVHQCFDFDLKEAERELREAIALQPDYALAHRRYALLLEEQRRFDAALVEIRRALELEPFTSMNHDIAAGILLNAGHAAEAAEESRRARALEPGEVEEGSRSPEQQQERVAQAIAAYEKTGKADPEAPPDLGAWADLGYSYGVGGRRKDAERILRVMDQLSAQRYVPAGLRVVVYDGPRRSRPDLRVARQGTGGPGSARVRQRRPAIRVPSRRSALSAGPPEARTLLRPGALAAAVLWICGAAAAQTTSGRIEGIVRDGSGGVLSGASVKATSPSLQGVRAAMTDARGRFRLAALPPGVYVVRAELGGFRTVEKPATVLLDASATVDLVLEPAIAEAVAVGAEAPRIDATSTTGGTNYPAAVVAKLPVDRNYADIVRSNPGVGTDRGDTQGRSLALTIYGATSAENQWIVDGINTTNVIKGIQGKAINNEFVQEVEVKTGGYQAEYGGALGGVVNVVTKSGGNEFHGDAFVYYDSSGTTAQQVFIESEDSPFSQMRVAEAVRLDFGADLGGFLVKDSLWFFGAYNRVELDSQVSRFEGGGDVTPSDRFPVDTTDNLYSFKLTWNATPSTSAVATVFADPSRSEGASGANPYLGPASVTPPVSLEHSTWYSSRDIGGTDFGARVTQLLSSQAIVILQGGVHHDKYSLGAAYAIRREDWMCVPGDPPGTRKTACTLPDEPNFVSGGYGGVAGRDDHNSSTREQFGGVRHVLRRQPPVPGGRRLPERPHGRAGVLLGRPVRSTSKRLRRALLCARVRRRRSGPSDSRARLPAAGLGRRTTARISRIRGGRRPV